MKNWIKTIDIGHSNVLVTRYWDDEQEDAPWVVEVSVVIRGVKQSAILRFISEAERDRAWFNYSAENAEKLYSGIDDMMKDLGI